MIDYIKMEDCKPGYLYKLRSRNLGRGVWTGNGFVGIREKFGGRFLDTELHHDTGPPFGSALPIKELGVCPIDDLAENGPPNEERVVKMNQVLFDWLDHCEEV